MKKHPLPFTFTEKVQEVVCAIPCGSVLTYAQVAQIAGNSKAARAVGTIMRKNYDEMMPCHRVIKSSGRVGNLKKQEILQKEGIRI